MTDPTSEQIIASATQLPLEDQFAIADALFENAMASSFGADDEVAASSAWKDEVAERLEDVEKGRVQTIPAEEAERMIQGGERPEV